MVNDKGKMFQCSECKTEVEVQKDDPDRARKLHAFTVQHRHAK